jgi:hypothetical protein
LKFFKCSSKYDEFLISNLSTFINPIFLKEKEMYSPIPGFVKKFDICVGSRIVSILFDFSFTDVEYIFTYPLSIGFLLICVFPQLL